jgi:hypothetical protein
MNKKSLATLALVITLCGLWVYYGTDWVSPPVIQIIKSNRPVRNPNRGGDVYPVAFSLDGKYALTKVWVISQRTARTNKNPTKLWHVVARTNAPPVKGFQYGQRIPGLSPALTNSRPARLQPGESYLLHIEAGRARGEIEFQAEALAPGDQ